MKPEYLLAIIVLYFGIVKLKGILSAGSYEQFIQNQMKKALELQERANAPDSNSHKLAYYIAYIIVLMLSLVLVYISGKILLGGLGLN